MGFRPLFAFVVEGAGGEGIFVQPLPADAQDDAAAFGAAQTGVAGQLEGEAGAVEEDGQAQGEEGVPHDVAALDLVGDFAYVAALAKGEGGEDVLFFAREAGHVGLGEDVGGVFVVGGVGDVGADFVQCGRPAQVLPPVFEFMHGDVLREAFEQVVGGAGDAFGLAAGDVVAFLEADDGLFAHVFVEAAADEIVENAVAQGGVGDVHGFDAEFFEYGNHHGQAAGEDFDALGFESFESGFFDTAGFGDTLREFFHAGVGDGFSAVAGFGGENVADGLG